MRLRLVLLSRDEQLTQRRADAGEPLELDGAEAVGTLRRAAAEALALEEADVRLVDYFQERRHGALSDMSATLDGARLCDGQHVLVEHMHSGEWPEAEQAEEIDDLFGGAGAGWGAIETAAGSSSPAGSAAAAEEGGPLDGSGGVPEHSGKVGLSNLGNTCFMASMLQSLAAVAPLREYFTSGAYERELNAENRDGTQGQLARSYAVRLCRRSHRAAGGPGGPHARPAVLTSAPAAR